MKRKILSRRLPRQKRAQETVDAVLDSVAKLLKRGGVQAVTTNRIAEVAGVSIGSLYQYFPNKEAIFAALKEMLAIVVVDELCGVGIGFEP